MKYKPKTGSLLGYLKPKARILYNAPGTINNITGIVNESEFSVIEMKTLQNLQHRSIGLWNSATPDNPKNVASGGSAIFRVQQMIQFGEYTAANRNDNGDLPKSEIKVIAHIDGQDVARYEIETLDLPGLGFGTREAFISYVAAGIGKNLAALMDAHYIDVFVKDAKDKVTTSGNERHEALVFPEGSVAADKPADGLARWKDATTATREANYLIVSDAKTDVARQLTRYNLGTDEAQYATMLLTNITKRLLLAMPKGGNSATAIGEKLTGNGDGVEVAGLGTVKDHIFFGKNIPAGSVFSKDTDFNFENVVGMIAHSEAAFVAIQGMVTTGTIAPNSGNQVYITKFNRFKKLIRDGLYRLIVSSQFTPS